jgi:hypothetical protein
MLSAVDGLDTLPIKSIRQKKMALMVSVLLLVFVRMQEREQTERIFHWSGHDMIFLFLSLNFHRSLQGNSLSGRIITRSVPLLSAYKHQLNRSFELCQSHPKLFLFFYYLCKMNCCITSSQPRHHWKSEKNPSSQVSRTCSRWIMTGKKARQQVFLSGSFVLCYIGQSVHI